jgi:methionyl-tRNA synthetase
MAEIEREKALEAEGAAAPGPSASAGAAPEVAPPDVAQVGNLRSEEEAGAGLTPPLAPTITIDDFAKIDLRVATVLEAERIPKADKLLRLQVDLGEGQPRQILAGIAMYYSPEQLIGKKIVVVANLAPRKLRGLESNGMLLAASVGEEGKPVLATFAEDVPNGARLK